MEHLQLAGKTRLIGVSNVSVDQLVELHGKARVKPALVQNRCYAALGWDHAVRSFCREHEVVYQGFSLLTANPEALAHPKLGAVAARLGKSAEQIVFRFATQVGMVALTGTRSVEHMRDDVGIYDFDLGAEEVRMIERLVA